MPGIRRGPPQMTTKSAERPSEVDAKPRSKPAAAESLVVSAVASTPVEAAEAPLVSLQKPTATEASAASVPSRALPPSYTSTAQWVVRHADVRNRCYEDDNVGKSQADSWSECTLSEAAAETEAAAKRPRCRCDDRVSGSGDSADGYPGTLYLLRRRASEPATAQQQCRSPAIAAAAATTAVAPADRSADVIGRNEAAAACGADGQESENRSRESKSDELLADSVAAADAEALNRMAAVWPRLLPPQPTPSSAELGRTFSSGCGGGRCKDPSAAAEAPAAIAGSGGGGGTASRAVRVDGGTDWEVARRATARVARVNGGSSGGGGAAGAAESAADHQVAESAAAAAAATAATTILLLRSSPGGECSGGGTGPSNESSPSPHKADDYCCCCDSGDGDNAEGQGDHCSTPDHCGGGEEFSALPAERSASFTNHPCPRRPAVAVHRSPSHPGRRPDFFTCDRRKAAIGGSGPLQVSRVRKVSSLRSFAGGDAASGDAAGSPSPPPHSQRASGISISLGTPFGSSGSHSCVAGSVPLDASDGDAEGDTYGCDNDNDDCGINYSAAATIPRSAGGGGRARFGRLWSSATAARSPIVKRRPPVPAVLQSPSTGHRLLTPPEQDALLQLQLAVNGHHRSQQQLGAGNGGDGGGASTPGGGSRLRPLTLHPEFRSIADHLNRSPSPEPRTANVAATPGDERSTVRAEDDDDAPSTPESGSPPPPLWRPPSRGVPLATLVQAALEEEEGGSGGGGDGHRRKSDGKSPSYDHLRATARRIRRPDTATFAHEPSSLEDEGIDGGAEWSAPAVAAQRSASPVAATAAIEPFVLVIADDSTTTSGESTSAAAMPTVKRSKPSKRSHTHPPSGSAAAAAAAAAAAVASTTGASSDEEHVAAAAGASTAGGGAGGASEFRSMNDISLLSSAARCPRLCDVTLAGVATSSSPVDSLYGSLPAVAAVDDTGAAAPAASKISVAATAVSASSSSSTSSASSSSFSTSCEPKRGDPSLAATALISGSGSSAHRLLAVAESKPKRVKSDPFPEGYPMPSSAARARGSGRSGSSGSAAAATEDVATALLGGIGSGGDSRAASEGCASGDGQPSSDGGDAKAFCASASTAATSATAGKATAEQRCRILTEIIEKEEIYVANLEQVTQAVSQLKEQQTLDGASVDKIFCSIRLPESRVHHKIFLESLRRVAQRWDAGTTTIGDRIASMFSSQSVLENYLSYVANCTKAKLRLEQAFKTKPNFCKFNDTFRRSNVSRQDLRAVLTLPANHLISYRFFIERMLKYTPEEHPDHQPLRKAREIVLELLMKVGGQDLADSEEAIRTLKKLESLLAVQDLAAADRSYIRNDGVTIKQNKRERCCIWMFSDLVLVTVLKGTRNSSIATSSSSGRLYHSQARRGSVTITSPRGQEIIEKCQHKLWLRLGLEDVDILSSPEAERRACTKEIEQIECDLDRLIKISEDANSLVIQHEKLQKTLLDMIESCRKDLGEVRQHHSAVDMTTLQLIAHGSGDVPLELTVQFENAEKRASWETSLAEAKLSLETALTEKLPPEFKDAIPITKTRAGMQFSCATPVEGSGPRDVWVCNSDSYVGHVCLLSLQPQPGVTMTATVPSCASRVVCACAVPAQPPSPALSAASPLVAGPIPTARRPTRRVGHVAAPPKRSRFGGKSDRGDSGGAVIPTDVVPEEDESESSSSAAADDSGGSSSDERGCDDGDESDADGATTAVEDLCIHETTNLTRNLVWLGTEDGTILIFSSEENLRTSRVRPARTQHPASVLCMVYLEQAVFVSLGNGALLVYRRAADGGWNLDVAETPSIGGSGGGSGAPTPIGKMLAVGGKLWCSYQNEIIVLDPHSLKAEISFAISNDKQRTVQSMACSRHGIVAVAVQGGCDVKLFHAASRKFLIEVNVAASVSSKLQACDDIIRQHKVSCLKITVLLACKDLLWIGTTAGVILTMALPKITPSMITSRELTVPTPTVTGLPVGHTGNVRFLTCTDLPEKTRTCTGGPSTRTQTHSVTTKLLVVSGGDGYENFDDSQANDTAAGSNDSVNHLLLWEV